ncbi:lysophospholipid acyltransferase family protein [Kordia algicida OT-1]|uniref:1-acyl-sn-glycerol-3-phosphate acyltransferase n=1 Tax=Kordia algicida OT-1 TaxID=391587 RepID=A9DT44_9FLAO|nr:lysophospholipid acyltransferase family protein [Kordia algicida]EDP97022.1 1-acyl-sn-glycerol-3-phosphate acyltransferase [Kordia algicida OT-1]
MITFLKNIAILIWRVWFYLLVLLPILIFFPLLLLFTASEKLYPQFFWIARNFWARPILFGMGFITKFKKEEEIIKGKSYMLIANHTSMTDIMLMLVASKNPFVFVGKKELSKIPIFGFFYKRTCILVDRGSARSRKAVYDSAQKRLNQGMSICIFPEGRVPEEDILLDEFKDGAFRLAIEHQIPIVPMTFADNKKRFSYTFFSGSPGRMRVTIHKFLSTAGKEVADKKELSKTARDIILKELEAYGAF